MKQEKELKQTKSNSTSNLSVIKDASGKAYIVNLDNNTILNQTSETITKTQDTTNFVGLSSDKSNFNPPINDEEAIEYVGWLAGNDCDTTIDWRTHTHYTKSANNVDGNAIEEEYTAIVMNKGSHPFFLDTGATIHISPISTDFISLKPISSRTVKGIGGSTISASGIGNVKLHILERAHIILKDVLYIPQAAVCLISISHMSNDSQITSHFDNHICWLTDKASNTIVARGTLTSRNLYALDLFEPQPENALIATAQPTIETWHRRLGHANYQAISDMCQNNMVTGMSFNSSTVPTKCQSCVTGKRTWTSVPKAWEEGRRATRRLGIVWVDLSGPHDIVSRRGNKYILNLVDDATSFPWSIPIPSKDVAYSELKAWELARENETGVKVGTYRTDNGELKSKALDKWLKSRGTRQEFTAPYTSTHNERVERMHRTLMNKARTMRIYADLPPNLWDELYLTASYLHAQTTTRSSQGSTPFTQWYKKKPNLSHLREIGCQAFVLIQDRNNPKIYQRSTKCVLIGYEPNTKAYRCYHRPSGQIFTSYHVSFVKSHQTAKVLTPKESTHLTTMDRPTDGPNQVATPTPERWQGCDGDDDKSVIEDVATDEDTDHHSTVQVHALDHLQLCRSSRIRKPIEKATTDRLEYQSCLADAVGEARMSAERVRKERVARLQQIRELHDKTPLDDQTPTGTEAIQLLKEIANNPENCMTDGITQKLGNLLATVSNEVPGVLFEEEPRTWDEAKRSPDATHWEAGYREELRSLKEMGVYELVP